MMNTTLHTTKVDELARVERLEYFRQWRAANPEKVKQHNKNYWKNRAIKKQQSPKEAN